MCVEERWWSSTDFYNENRPLFIVERKALEKSKILRSRPRKSRESRPIKS